MSKRIVNNADSIITADSTTHGPVAAVVDSNGEPLSNYGGFGKGLFGRGLFGRDPGSIVRDSNTGKIL